MLRSKSGIDAMYSVEAGEAFELDFVVIAVNKASIADVCAEWAVRGYPVLCETPAGVSLEKLCMLWDLHERGNARISVCEQYHRYPEIAAGLLAISQGRIGTPSSAYLSLCHDYHAASVLRRMLGTKGEAFSIRAAVIKSPVVETDSRYGPITDGRMSERERVRAYIEYESGKNAVYDFSGVQYHSFLRTRHLLLRCDRGEWNDRSLLYLDGEGRPRAGQLRMSVPDRYRELETPELREFLRAERLSLGMENIQDEFAMATMLFDMREYIEGGDPPYPLREALDDAYFWLLLQEALRRPWEEVRSGRMSWME